MLVICMPEHLGLLGAACWKYKIVDAPFKAGYYANLLAWHNVRVISSVYFDRNNGFCPGPKMFEEHIIEAAAIFANHYAEHWPLHITEVDLITYCNFYYSQCCWPRKCKDFTPVRIIRKLRRMLVRETGVNTYFEWQFIDVDTRIPRVLAAYRFHRMKTRKQAIA